MRLIDADVLIEIIREQGIRGSGWSDSERESDVIDMIDSISTDDTGSARCGKWEPVMKNGNQYGGYKCSACGKKVSIRGSHTYNFCPYCGVRVRSTALFPPGWHRMLKVLEINGTVEEFMETETFKKAISEPTKTYYDAVYTKVTSELTAEQKNLYDDWWFNRKPVPSDECFWKGVSDPEGYEKYSTLDIKIVNDAILYTACQGCG